MKATEQATLTTIQNHLEKFNCDIVQSETFCTKGLHPTGVGWA